MIVDRENAGKKNDDTSSDEDTEDEDMPAGNVEKEVEKADGEQGEILNPNATSGVASSSSEAAQAFAVEHQEEVPVESPVCNSSATLEIENSSGSSGSRAQASSRSDIRSFFVTPGGGPSNINKENRATNGPLGMDVELHNAAA